MKLIKQLADLQGIAKKYRKKPVVIKAVRLTEGVRIKTLEGTLIAKPGDYIIEGVEGEIYPCDQTIFWKTYEDAE